MNSLLYFFAEYFPFWGLPAGFILLEIANHSRRNSRVRAMAIAALFSFLFFGLTAYYFWLGGHQAVRAALQDIEYKYYR